MKPDESLMESMNNLKDAFTEIWDELRETVSEIVNVREEFDRKTSLRETWHVPIKINIPKLPHIKELNIPRIRSNL